VVKVAVGDEHSIFADSHGKAWSMGSGSFGQLGTGNATDQMAPNFIGLIKGEAIVDVSAGAFTSAFVTLDHRIWVCGFNGDGRLFMKDSDHIYVPTDMSMNGKNAELAELTVPISVSLGGTHSCIVDNKGQVFLAGANDSGQLGIPDFDTNHERLKNLHKYSLALGDELAENQLDIK